MHNHDQKCPYTEISFFSNLSFCNIIYETSTIFTFFCEYSLSLQNKHTDFHSLELQAIIRIDVL
jgi:hypothetical protein